MKIFVTFFAIIGVSVALVDFSKLTKEKADIQGTCELPKGVSISQESVGDLAYKCMETCASHDFFYQSFVCDMFKNTCSCNIIGDNYDGIPKGATFSDNGCRLKLDDWEDEDSMKEVLEDCMLDCQKMNFKEATCDLSNNRCYCKNKINTEKTNKTANKKAGN